MEKISQPLSPSDLFQPPVGLDLFFLAMLISWLQRLSPWDIFS
jgi:hypothetical protein